ncbi:hypothetical protein VTL71DRAFT_14625 [Oculimacula yallundae]|uniref:UBC core domain-containing protein n=1 Tax=Oculimacula yallundae TaxID=86028 RepID=A0ABR4CIZ7_9HELO
MPRKAFVADVQAANDRNIPGISSVVRGPDDDVIVTFTLASGTPLEINFMAQPDVASYPNESMFMAYTNTEGAPMAAAAALEEIANYSFGKRLPDLITMVSQKLQRALATGSRSDPVALDDEDTEMIDVDADNEDNEEEDDEEDEEEDYYPDEDEGFDLGSGRNGSSSHANVVRNIDPESAATLNSRIRHDIRSAKLAGFSVGILSGMKAGSENSILSLSIRVAKLGLSDEAVQAWDLEPQQYLVLLIRYSSGYKCFEDVIDDPAKTLDVAFRVGVSNKYKCTLLEALAAFRESASDGRKDSITEIVEDEPPKIVAGFSNIFISSSLNDFINTQFVSLLKIRNSVGVGWDGAKSYLNDKQGRLDEQTAELASQYLEQSDTQKDSNLPNSIAVDHLTDHQVKTISFPFIAAQFTLRYLTECTKFCLVCHDKIEEDFEALKPYVCSKPLCLYQYMSLGFGPSVEHEILTQPYVVDLLISFCYASAYARRLRVYPTGMSLSVPPVQSSVTNYSYGGGRAPQIAGEAPDQLSDFKSLLHEVKFDIQRQEITFDPGLSSCPVRNGDWVVITAAGRPSPDHFRIEDISYFPLVKMSSTAVNRLGSGMVSPASNISAVPTPSTTPPPPQLVQGALSMYKQNFDEMNELEKAETIILLLETLPSVRELRTFLIQQSRESEPSLRSWKERISPAALGILRWIIASNRSCIVQVDRCPGQSDAELAQSKTRLDQRLTGISESWVQFRFAQGSPDKEQRFLDALRAQQSNLDPKYPTLFAWHGSSLCNWHSIIRTGLDFKETLNGRAYGHGVYHAIDQTTSIGYAGRNSILWHGSALNIQAAMSLNEIVNCPTQFVNSNPFLVVQHIDWIQCRYLLVQVQSGSSTLPDHPGGGNLNVISSPVNTVVEVEQDPKRPAISTLQKPIGVPLCAASISRAFHVSAVDAPARKKRKHSTGIVSQVVELESDGENISDIDFLFTDDERTSAKGKGKANGKLVTSTSGTNGKPLTDFVAGSLDQSSLPMLQPPLYATSSATKTLSRNLKEILTTQGKTPMHELGWYINPDLITNVYQWIVELHSFDPTLPLAKDMKAAGVTSIVLEIRFGKDYPFSPPFVRVIRPRFLPFASGGGGHVTAGGAMCMELLTNTGWTSVSTIESVLLQVRVEMMSLDRPARLESTSKYQQGDYGTAEAIDAYERSCKMHGWAIPPGFRDFANPLPGAAGPSA